MTGASTARDRACPRHRGEPLLSSCVTCGVAMCAKCIVRTPVGFKCSSCTGGGSPTISKRRADHDSRRAVPAPRHGELPDRGRRRHIVTAAAAVVVAVVVSIAGYALTRSSPSSLPAAQRATPSPAGLTDVAVQLSGAAGHAIGGNLVLPARPSSSQPSPGVLIVPDYGTVDRNGPSAGGTTRDPMYADLAQLLATRGIASLRYDPAGQGQSTLPAGTALRLPDLVGDADAGVRFLAARVDIDTRRLIVIGHGWGGLVALQLAAQDPAVTGVAIVGTPGRPVVDTVADQLQATATTPADGQAAVAQLRSTVAALLAGAALPPPAQLQTSLRPILQQGQETYLRAIFGLNPTALAAQVHLPVLIVRGAQDPAITAVDADLLTRAFGPHAQVLTAAGAGHTLSITTASPTTASTLASPNAGMQNIHMGDANLITTVRDEQTLGAIALWVLPAAGPSQMTH